MLKNSIPRKLANTTIEDVGDGASVKFEIQNERQTILRNENQGTFIFCNARPNFLSGVTSIFDFRPITEKFDLYLKEDDEVIDHLSIQNDWRTVENDLLKVMNIYHGRISEINRLEVSSSEATRSGNESSTKKERWSYRDDSI